MLPPSPCLAILFILLLPMPLPTLLLHFPVSPTVQRRPPPLTTYTTRFSHVSGQTSSASEVEGVTHRHPNPKGEPKEMGPSENHDPPHQGTAPEPSNGRPSSTEGEAAIGDDLNRILQMLRTTAGRRRPQGDLTGKGVVAKRERAGGGLASHCHPGAGAPEGDPTWRPCDDHEGETEMGVEGDPHGVSSEDDGEGDEPWVRATVILPASDEYLPSLGRVVPALKLAILDARKRQILPPGDGIGTGNGVRGKEFKLIERDSKCSATLGCVRAVDAYATDCAHVMFGPSCEFAVACAGRMVQFWGIPLLTAGALTFDFTKPKTKPGDEFYMMLRVGLSFRDITDTLVKTMFKFEWKKVFLMYNVNGYMRVSGPQTCKNMMSTLAEYLKINKIQYGVYDMGNNAQPGSTMVDTLRSQVGFNYASSRALFGAPPVHRTHNYWIGRNR